MKSVKEKRNLKERIIPERIFQDLFFSCTSARRWLIKDKNSSERKNKVGLAGDRARCRQKAKKSIVKITFCAIGEITSQTLIKPEEYL